MNASNTILYNIVICFVVSFIFMSTQTSWYIMRYIYEHQLCNAIINRLSLFIIYDYVPLNSLFFVASSGTKLYCFFSDILHKISLTKYIKEFYHHLSIWFFCLFERFINCYSLVIY